MHRLIVPTLLFAGLGVASAATATTETGTLASASPATAQVTFVDGEIFNFPDTSGYRARIAEFRPGEVASINREGDNKNNWAADAIWPASPVYGYAVP